jgi:hypothetical protein
MFTLEKLLAKMADLFGRDSVLPSHEVGGGNALHLGGGENSAGDKLSRRNLALFWGF